MKKLLLVLFAALFVLPVYGQRIETRDSGQDQIVRVATALNHLTVIELGEPVLSVASGSQAFRIEWRGNKVFVEPTEAGVSTNLFIWTKAGRENYELEPAGPVQTMDFAIDTAAPNQGADPPSPRPAVKVTVPDDPAEPAVDAMLGGTPVRQDAWRTKKHRVQVIVRDLFEQEGVLYIRYSIENGTKKVYAPGTPQVVNLSGGTSSRALASHVYTQVNPETVAELKTARESPVEITAHESRGETVAPGAISVGVVGVTLAGSGPAILRLEFKDAGGYPVCAVVVI